MRLTRRRRAPGPARAGPPVPRLARARDVRMRPRGPAGGARRALAQRGRAGTNARGALPAGRAPSVTGERGCGGTIAFCASGVRRAATATQPILLAGESAGARLPFGCRMGICHSCVGRLRSGQVRDLRTGQVHGQRGELLRTCINAPEGADRDRALNQPTEDAMSATSQTSHARAFTAEEPTPDDPRRRAPHRERQPAGPPQRRADRAARARARRDPRARCTRTLGERDARYIRSDDQAAPPARARRARAAAGSRLHAAVAGRHGRAVDRQDPREHGDRPQRDARPVGLDERPGHQLPDLGLGHRLAGRRLAALAQLRAPHLHQHPRQGPRPGLRDHAHRPAPEMAPGLPPAAALQPAADGLLRVGRGAARPQLRRDPPGEKPRRRCSRS